MQKLLDNGADPNIKDDFNRTALEHAENNGESVSEAVKALLNNHTGTLIGAYKE